MSMGRSVSHSVPGTQVNELARSDRLLELLFYVEVALFSLSHGSCCEHLTTTIIRTS
jgi:hypothetical protein